MTARRRPSQKTVAKGAARSKTGGDVPAALWPAIVPGTEPKPETPTGCTMTQVKICGLSEPDTLETAIGAGADFVGFIFFEPSPRNVSLERAGALGARVAGRAKKVAVTVDADNDRLAAIIDALEPDYLQVHGSEDPARVRHISERFGLPVIKVIKVRGGEDVAQAADYAGTADLIMFDAKAPEDLAGALPGGNGVQFDWTLLGRGEDKPAFLLSGGLDADNVGDALRTTGAPIIDVSSGVERAPGVKDSVLIRKFIEAARAAG